MSVGAAWVEIQFEFDGFVAWARHKEDDGGQRLHPTPLGLEGALLAAQRFLEHVEEPEGVWFADRALEEFRRRVRRARISIAAHGAGPPSSPRGSGAAAAPEGTEPK